MRDVGAAAVDRATAPAYVGSRRGTEKQRQRAGAGDCRARRSEAAALLRERRSGEHPERLGTASTLLSAAGRRERRDERAHPLEAEGEALARRRVGDAQVVLAGR